MEWKLIRVHRTHKLLNVLIVPCGMETAMKAVGAAAPEVLIVPCGMKTYVIVPFPVSGQSISCTLGNDIIVLERLVVSLHIKYFTIHMKH